MKKFLPGFLLLIFILPQTYYSNAQTPVGPQKATALQSLIDDFIVQHDLPGISVSLLLPGDLYWHGASGLSHIYNLTPMDTSHLFHLASVNKMYVSAMIMQLYEQGMLSLDDSLGMYLPAMTNVPAGTTIRNLLRHRTGIADVAGAPGMATNFFTYPDSIWPHLQTIQTFCGTPLFAQGQAFNYSNTNYILLGMIIESITGNTFAQELHNRFLIPFGFTQSFFEPEDSVAGPYTPGWTSFTTPNTYDTDASAMLNDCSASMFFTAGSMVAKPAEVAKFTRALWTGQVISDSLLTTMQQCTNVTFSDGCNGYGYGTMRYMFHSKLYYGHAGDVNGFTQLSIHQQEDTVTLVISVNRNGAPRKTMATDILALLSQLTTSVSDNINSINNLFVYPNPAKDVVNIQLNSEEKEMDVMINDMQGRVVIDLRKLNNTGVNQIDISSLSKGTYFINCKSAGYNISKKLIVL